jgi:hypothetical protein
VALTDYYDPNENLGLGYGFDALGSYLRTVPRLGEYADALICGYLFGPKGCRLDPWKMGMGLVNWEQVRCFCDLLKEADWPEVPGPESELYAGCYYRPSSTSDVRHSRDCLVKLYRQAHEGFMGLLLVDFNDRGVGGL